MLPEYGVKGLDWNLWNSWSAADAGLDFEILEQQRAVELRSKRVFLDPPVVRQVTRADGPQLWLGPVKIPSGTEELILTYLANLLQAGTNTTPYSMVTAAGPPYTPADMRMTRSLSPTGWRMICACSRAIGLS